MTTSVRTPFFGRGAAVCFLPTTVPFAWRERLGYDGALLSALTWVFVKLTSRRTWPAARAPFSTAIAA